MPYGTKYRRKKTKKVMRKKKNYISKLKDKKINTLIEKRIQQIAKDEIRNFAKRKVIYRNTDTQFNWEAHSPWLRVPSASCITENAGTLFHLDISDIGDTYINNLTGNADSKKSRIAIDGFKSLVTFRYQGTYPAKYTLAYIEMTPNEDTASYPVRDMLRNGSQNGLFYYNRRGISDDLDQQISYRVLKQKTITIKPAILYTNSLRQHNANELYQNPIQTEVEKRVNFDYKFPKPKMLVFSQKSTGDNEAENPLQKSYFLCLIGDSVMTFYNTTQTTLCVESPTDAVIPIGNNGAPPA